MLGFTRHDSGEFADGTVVLLHSLAMDRGVWDGVVPLLAARYDVIAVDLSNHGASPRLEDTTIEGMADEVAAVIRAQVGGAAVVVGMSLGGCVAQALAAAHPELVRGLGLVDTTCWYGPTAAEDWQGRADKAVSEGLDSLAEFQLARWFSPGFVDTHPEVAEQLLAVFRGNDIDGYVDTCRAMGAMDLRETAGSITAPTSILVGELDPATPPSHAEDLRQRIDGAGLHVLPGCSHLSPVESPELVASLLAVDLFDRVDPFDEAELDEAP